MAVVGTRPEAIKTAPVLHALAARGLSPLVLLTGQHPALEPADYGLDRFATERLGCPGQPDPLRHAEAVASAAGPVVAGSDLVIVQGDTSSALGGALAAFAADVPVAHVEAGLRTHDRLQPWPEEDNRVTIDARAALLFAPTEVSAANLRAEGVPGTIHVTGNTAVDALRGLLGRVPVPHLTAVNERPRLLVTCHRRENWGAAFRPIAEALLELARTCGVRIDVLLPPNGAVAAEMRAQLAGCYGIRLLAPLDHAGMIAAMRAATIVLSDSGGVQEEAPALGVPLLVLREKTERPEGIATGNMRLVGSDARAIVREVRRLLEDDYAFTAMARPALPYGDGHAAERIAQVITSWLSAGSQRDRLIA